MDVEPDPSQALFHAAEGSYDLLIVSLSLENFDGLRLCSQARSLERTRQVPILAISDADNNARLLRGLEIGVNDYLLRPIDRNELLARARTQIKRRRYTDHLRDNVQNSIEMAITDALTGLHNRRYFHETLAREVARAHRYSRNLALVVFDLDDFKAINDRIGHLAGDAVLAEAADRIRDVVRSADVACRVGGDEFAVILPESGVGDADQLYRRLEHAVSTKPVGQAGRLHLSAGVTELRPDDDAVAFFERADEALYRAKGAGKATVVAVAARPEEAGGGSLPRSIQNNS